MRLDAVLGRVAGWRLGVEPLGVRFFTSGETFLVAALLYRLRCIDGPCTWLLCHVAVWDSDYRAINDRRRVNHVRL
ncbi:hypothetical protein DBR22_01720 [Arthrobacter sp. HMWF013]|nr:hypothetical protein DBR22_01720 [Arthrobacter sp. HMWF013]